MKRVIIDWFVPDSDTYFASHLTSRGFEIDKLDKALSYCDNFRMAIDGGSHIGTWAINMAKRFESVVAFEPAPDCYECLVANVEARRITNITAKNVALGKRSGWCSISDESGNTGSRTISYGDDGPIPVMAIDEFNYPSVDFIKLDVEGSEIPVLKGALKTIEKCRPVMIVECKSVVGRHYTAAQVVQYVESLGYREAGGRKSDRVFTPR